jgi:hypothetical protein
LGSEIQNAEGSGTFQVNNMGFMFSLWCNIIAMNRYSTIVLLLFVCAAASAQKPASLDELAGIAARGKLLYEYDQAAWHSTDAVQPAGAPKGVIDR